MSWINSSTTDQKVYPKKISQDTLSFYHGFSKTPVEPNTSTGVAQTSLANASTKAGHTVIGTEVWAEEIPWFGLVASRTAAVERLSGLTKLNDLVKVDGENGKVYKYIGADDAVFTEAQWSSFWQEVTLTNGMTLNNRHNQPVLRYYLNQPMQTLTTTNNASIDSKGFATRLFVDESTHLGKTSGGSVVSQFAAGTDNIKNGIPSVELNPKLYLGTTEKIAGTHYYDYNVSGTILWSTAVTSSSPKISCFRYIGKTVTGQLSTVESTISSHTIDISDIKTKLGMGDTNPDGTQSVTARVETVEDVVRVLLGLSDSDAIAATESIAATANTAATTAINGALEESGSIAQAIADAEDRVKVTTDALSGRIAQLEGIAHFSVEVVDALPTALVENTIYLVPEDGVAEGTYIEYIAYKPKDSETVVTEKIGSTALDLSGYTTDEEHTALAGRVTTVEGKVTTLEGQVATLTGDETTDGSVAKALADAKTYAEEQASAAQSAAESTAAGELSAAVEQIGKDIEAAKNEAISSAEVTITAGTGIVVTPEGKGTTFEISVSDAVATASDLTALTNRVTTLETTTVPGIDTRLQAAEATITSLTEEGGVIDSIESEIEDLAGETGRVTVVEGKVSDIETSLAEGGATANAIKAAQDTADAKVASVTVTDTTGTITTGGSDTAPVFTVAGGEISDAETKFVSGSTVKTYVDGQVSDAKSEIKTTTDALAEDIQSIKDVIGEGENGENIIDILSGIRTDLDATTATANTAAQSAEGDTYVSASQTDTKITVTTNIAAITSHVDTELVKTGTAVATAISAVQTAVEGKSLASTSTGSDLVTVTTTGTVGAGMTTTVDTTALATAISTAESNAISAAKALTLSATDTDDSGKVTVALGGTVETPTITVTTSDIASASTLSDLVSTVNTHIAEAAGLYLSVEKVDTLPADTDAKTNKIYLVPVDTEAGREQNIHTEYIWTNNKWEIIGTTAIDINSLEAAAEAAQSTADTALANAATAQGEVDALEEVVATKANASEVISSITDAKGTTVTGAITVKDERETVTENDLWGTTATMSEDGILTIAHDWVTNSNLIDSWNTSITKVEDNKAYTGEAGDTFYANIQTERIKDGSALFRNSQLTSFNGDLSSLVNGLMMFSGSQLTSFNGDLSSLVMGNMMFSGSQLTSFNGDLSSLINGYAMFSSTPLTSFNSDLSSLVNGHGMFNKSQLTSFTCDLSSLVTAFVMFESSQLTSFNGDLSSLVNGQMTFENTPLTSFNGDLSSLVNGVMMFSNTNLDMESLETICDTLPKKSDLKTWNDTTKTYEAWDGSSDFVYSYTSLDENCNKVQITGTVHESEVATIGITYSNVPTDENTINAITALFEETANTKGWTIVTNAELGGTYTPSVAMADGTVQHYIYAIKHEADEETANYVDADGKYWVVDTAEAIIGPNVKYWSLFRTLEDAITEWALTPYTQA